MLFRSAPRRLWSSSDDIVYALALDPAGRLVIGTGNGGRIFRIESEQAHSLVVKAAPSQITALLRDPDGRLLAASANVGKVFRLGPDLQPRGSFESEVFDAGAFTHWGRLEWKGTVPAGAAAVVETRSGNLNAPAQYWSPWSKAISPGDGARIESPSARFLQWRAVLETRGADSPVVHQVTVAYRPKNVAPVITEMEMTPPNYRFPDPPAALSAPPTLTLPAIGSRSSRDRKSVV